MTVQTEASSAVRGISVLLFSDDRAVRDAVRMGVGRRPAEGVAVESWHECATADGVMLALQEEEFDVLVLDGEAQPYGGLGVCRQIKNEIHDCPPIMVLIGRPGDGWLAAWSQADAVVSRPLRPAELAEGIAGLVRP
ncbi:response regulator transcription factor [Ornithinimicrobium cavernae]|uniref:response regulator transcription factor n=1 Tax=Ornithinimicrobium cavernae TaxID=2666047 RepID=UPI000D690AD9|nr:response regulator transcription factor [Ornithinimicrobium cavernae]